MESSEDDEDIFEPHVKKKEKTSPPSLPVTSPKVVQLTWKGVPIYFPSVVLTKDLKVKADAVLKKLISKKSESSRTGSVSTISDLNTGSSPSVVSDKSSASSPHVSSSGQHQCGICRCNFRSEYALKRHSLVHTNTDDPNKKHGPCKCGAKFSKRQHFRSHVDVCFIANSTSATEVEAVLDPELDSQIHVKVESVDLNSTSGREQEITNPTHHEDHGDSEVPGNNTNDTEGWREDDQIPVVTSVSTLASNVSKCFRCNAQFTLKVHFIHHKRICERMCQNMDENGRERKFQCLTCPWKFFEAKLLRRHSMTSHKGVRPYHCPFCFEGFTRKDYMNAHQLNCSSSISAAHSESLPSYTKAPHPAATVVNQVIFDPGRPIITSSELPTTSINANKVNITSGLEHLNSSESKPESARIKPSSAVTCTQCFRKFAGMCYLKQHICRPKKNNTARNVLEPGSPMSSSGSEDVSCPYCGVKFSKSSNRIKHMRMRHKCSQCGEDFQNVAEKINHSNMCTGIPPARGSDLYSKYKCHICRVPFGPQQLARHILSHSNITTTDSPSPFSNLDSFTNYELAESPGQSPPASMKLKCDLCGDKFSDNMELSRHCLNHAMNKSKPQHATSDETPPPPVFPCKFRTCTHFFSHDEDLWYHVDKKHKSVGNICCGQCGQDFKTEALVEDHEQKAHVAAVAVFDPPHPFRLENEHSPLVALSADIARVTNTTPSIMPFVNSVVTPGPSSSMAERFVETLTSNSSNTSTILLQPTVAVKTENAEAHHDHDGFSHFDEDAIPEPDLRPRLLIPETKLAGSVGAKQPLNIDPYVFISREDRDAANMALQKTSDLTTPTPIKSHISAKQISKLLSVPVPYGLEYYCCTICFDLKTFTERDLYVLHLKEHSAAHAESVGKVTTKEISNTNVEEESIVAFTCHVCSAVGTSRTFNTRSAYRSHLRYHRTTGRTVLKTTIPEADEYLCKICNNRQFTDRKFFIRHMRIHKRIKQETGFDKPLVVVPRRADIPIQSEYECTVCKNRKFTDRKAYLVHINYHTKAKKIALEKEREKEKKLLRIQQQRPDIPISSTGEYFCSTCDNRKFEDRISYISHVRHHEKLQRHGKDRPIGVVKSSFDADIPFSDIYNCVICDNREFTERLSYVQHLKYHAKIRNDEGQDRPIAIAPTKSSLDFLNIPLSGVYICATCDNREFTERLSYIQHLRYHAKIRKDEGQDRPIATAPVKSSLDLETPYSDVYNCVTCDNREFTQRLSYIQHLKYHEKIRKDEGQDRPIAFSSEGVRPLKRPDIPISDIYTCDLCEDNKTFTVRREYLAHLCQHKAIQKKSFKSSNHWWKKQPGPNSWQATIQFSDVYKCETCPNRTFTNRDSYIGHVSYHRILEKQGRNRAIPTKQEWIKSREHHKTEVPDGQESYVCQICTDGRTFSSRASYISHIMYHETRKRMGINRPLKRKREPLEIPESGFYTCLICEDRKFTKKIHYIMHIRYHEKIRKEEGKDRPIRSDWREYRKRNSAMSKIPDAETYRCELCDDGRSFTNKNAYYLHISYHKKREQQGHTGPLRKRGAMLREDVPLMDEYTCTRCEVPRTFTDRKVYINHDNYHNLREKMELTGPIQKRRRKSSVSGVPFQSVYRCKQCSHLNKTFTDRHKYILHLNYHNRQDIMSSKGHNDSQQTSGVFPNFEQTSSGEFLSGSEVTNIREKVPNDKLEEEDKFYCTLCGTDTVFTSRERFEAHMKVHKAMKKKEFQCSICEKSFASMWNLKNHAKSHTGEKIWICGDCGKRFITKFLMQRHQLTSCKKVPCKYTCHCGDKFHSVDALEGHVKKDHNETKQVSKIFRCYVCNDQFLQAFELDQHVKDNHPVDYAEFMQHKLEKQQMETGNNDPDLGGDDEDFEPFYPEILMGCPDEEDDSRTDNVLESDTRGPPSAQYNSGAEISLPINDTGGGGGGGGGGGWNFIPGLTGEIEENNDSTGSSDSDQMDDEFTPDSFEPEDVEVPGGSLDNHNNTTSLGQNYPQMTISRSKERIPFARRQTMDVDEDWTPSGSSQQSQNPVSKRKYKTDGKYQCGYCTKTSHRIAYIKMHFAVHQGLGLPFKYIDLNNDLNRGQSESEVRLRTLPQNTTPMSTLPSSSTSTMYSSVRPLQYVLPQITPSPVVATVSPLTQTIQQQPSTAGRRRSSLDGNSTSASRPRPVCSCAFEDTALGYHKRCTGETCNCYTKYKGCSVDCDCKGSCGNPYFRTKAPVPASALPNIAALTPSDTIATTRQIFQQQPGLSESNITTYPPGSRVLDVVNSVIEGAFRQTQASSPPQTMTTYSVMSVTPLVSRLSTQSQSQPLWFINTGQQQTRTLGNVTGYANPTSVENYYNTQSDNNTSGYNNSPLLIQSLTNPMVANVQPTQTTMVDGTPSSSWTFNPSMSSNPSYSATSNTFKVRVAQPNLTSNGQGNNQINPPLTTGVQFNRINSMQMQTQPQPSSQNKDNSQKIYRCFCHKDFNTLGSFLLHQWDHKEEKLFLCPICKKQFSSVNFLVLHARQHTDVEDISLVHCVVCDKLTMDKNELDRHFTYFHADLICDVCQKYCASNAELASHRLTHGVCNICGLTFFNQTAMRNHLARDHPSLQSQFRVQSVPNTASSSYSHKLTTATISSGDGRGEPEIVTLVDLEDEDMDISPPSPEAPVIVSVAGTTSSTQSQDYNNYFTY